MKLFNEWLAENDSPDKNEKIVADLVKWGESLEGVNEVTISKYSGGQVSMFFKTNYGVWCMNLEAARKKKGVDDFTFSQTYSTDYSNLKWYMSWPNEYNRYNHRANVKQASPKTFKTVLIEALKVYEVFDKTVEFSELLDKKVEKWKKARLDFKTNADFSIQMALSNGEIAYAHGESTNLGISKWVVLWKDKDGTRHRESLDLLTGDFYFKLLKAIDPNNEKVEDILDILKDKPADNVWETIKSGDWNSVAHQLRGSLTGKKYNI